MFLGVTFTFAGLQKLANPAFFRASNPGSIEAQLNAFAPRSPLHVLLAIALHQPVLIGVVIAVGELAVGLGTLLGILPRLAAAGGMMISTILFLSVSFHTNPYYTGSDIVFMFAWIPFIIIGSGGVLTVHNYIARRGGGEAHATIAGVDFITIQKACGNYDQGSCNALDHAPCSMVKCPVINKPPHLDENDARISKKKANYDSERRSFLVRAGSLGVAGGAAICVGGTSVVLGRMIGATNSLRSSTAATDALASSTVTTTQSKNVSSSGTVSQTQSSASTTTTEVPTTVASGNPNPKGTLVGPASAVPVGKVASFVDPKSGQPAYVLHPKPTDFKAFSAICPHAGCTVQYSVGNIFICPCHGSQFDASNGNVMQGPAMTGLRPIPIEEGTNGQLYADG